MHSRIKDLGAEIVIWTAAIIVAVLFLIVRGNSGVDIAYNGAFLVAPQLVLLGLTRILRLRQASILGIAIALAFHPVIVWLALVTFTTSRVWWWMYVVTLPGALVGCVTVRLLRSFINTVRAVGATVVSGAVVLGGILANSAVSLSLGG